MIALVMSASSSDGTWSLGVLLFLVPIGLLLAPQSVRKDRRTIATVVALAVVAIGAPVYAAICNVCDICDRCAWWWCPIECWFL